MVTVTLRAKRTGEVLWSGNVRPAQGAPLTTAALPSAADLIAYQSYRFFPHNP